MVSTQTVPVNGPAQEAGLNDPHALTRTMAHEIEDSIASTSRTLSRSFELLEKTDRILMRYGLLRASDCPRSS